MAKLTPKQQRFVDEYLIDLNATQACIRAGYSEKTAKEMGAENLTKPNIQNAIQQAMSERQQRTKINADYVLNRLVQIDQLDIADILDETGNFKPISEWSKEWRLNLSSFEIVENATGGFVKKIKFPDKVKNLELLGKHVQIGAWANNQSVDVTAVQINQNETMGKDEFRQIAKEVLGKI
ncbi:terminase small subunit [Moraxella bovis]|uniref:Terminase small subunit n=1 Tax=Moraxella bovis TaxID=476 RepID=A0AAX3EQV0_MORBO|nr:terminase small subunit [Moraxella bovis]UZA50423.1 terminase small subunit [Moraxella bovis]